MTSHTEFRAMLLRSFSPMVRYLSLGVCPVTYEVVRIIGGFRDLIACSQSSEIA